MDYGNIYILFNFLRLTFLFNFHYLSDGRDRNHNQLKGKKNLNVPKATESSIHKS